MKSKKIYVDMILNIFANAVPIVVLQIFILPILARTTDGDGYGLILTYISIMNIFPAAFGTVLNNIRLLSQNHYQEKNITGDFSFLLLLFVIIDAIIVFFLTLFYEKNVSFIDVTLIMFMSSIIIAREYYRVAFRVELNYNAIFCNNGCLALGYIVGFIIYTYNDRWQIIYIFGNVFSIIYIVRKTTIWKEGLFKTELFKHTSKESFWLVISSLLGRVITYADKLILYPIVGGELVAVYFAANIFGKLISLLITPINNVALSYIAKLKVKSKELFKYTLLVVFGVSVIGYFVCIMISKPLLNILYPQYVLKSMQIIKITTLSGILQIVISTINPFLLKFCGMKWQVRINIITLVCYFLISVVGLHTFGLWGFCMGVVFTNIIKIIVMISIFYFGKDVTIIH